MARRAGLLQINDVLEQLDDSEWVAEGSDDDLEMDYDSVEGIVLE